MRLRRPLRGRGEGREKLTHSCDDLYALPVYVAAKLKDVVSSAAQLHGWNQPAAVNLNMANIPMPTEEERAEMRALDRKLDAYAKLIRQSNPSV
jgi:hypothetical protein